MASMYYIVDLSGCGPAEIAEQFRGAAHNIEIARRRDLTVQVVPVGGKDVEIGFSGHAGSVAAAYGTMRAVGTYRPNLIFAKDEGEVEVLQVAAPGVAVELEPGVPDVGHPA